MLLWWCGARWAAGTGRLLLSEVITCRTCRVHLVLSLSSFRLVFPSIVVPVCASVCWPRSSPAPTLALRGPWHAQLLSCAAILLSCLRTARVPPVDLGLFAALLAALRTCTE